ncbi:MAG: hypothetical protein Q8N63_04205 [Nanoarchaeota archaeon]|nr:hypothetical protein [Nanoarchaeota archaeon]
MDKLHITLIVALILIIIFFGIPYLQNNEKDTEVEIKQPETFKINLTPNQVSDFIGLDELYRKRVIENITWEKMETICLNACGKQCVTLGYTYETSTYIQQTETWTCYCECNK